MKQFFLALCLSSLTLACTNQTAKKEEAPVQVKGLATEEAPMHYAYTIDKPDQWVTGPRENTRMVLQSLKDFELGNVEASMAAFADSVTLRFDGFDKKMSRAEATAYLKEHRSKMAMLRIRMNDFESVRSKDGKEAYVSLWYTQIWDEGKGIDSLSVMDDVKLEGGKIVSIDEKQRRFGKKE